MAVTDAMSRIVTKTREAQEHSTAFLKDQECKAVSEPWADEGVLCLTEIKVLSSYQPLSFFRA
jgi:hypothetical protein